VALLLVLLLIAQIFPSFLSNLSPYFLFSLRFLHPA
jgi:hypothetical protein